MSADICFAVVLLNAVGNKGSFNSALLEYIFRFAFCKHDSFFGEW
jgi:hypothetical protein